MGLGMLAFHVVAIIGGHQANLVAFGYLFERLTHTIFFFDTMVLQLQVEILLAENIEEFSDSPFSIVEPAV